MVSVIRELRLSYSTGRTVQGHYWSRKLLFHGTMAISQWFVPVVSCTAARNGLHTGCAVRPTGNILEAYDVKTWLLQSANEEMCGLSNCVAGLK